jgi:hypothetical protein
MARGDRRAGGGRLHARVDSSPRESKLRDARAPLGEASNFLEHECGDVTRRWRYLRGTGVKCPGRRGKCREGTEKASGWNDSLALLATILLGRDAAVEHPAGDHTDQALEH